MSARADPRGGRSGNWYPYRDLIDPVVSAIVLRQLTAVSNKAVVLGSRDATLITSFAVSAYGCSPCSGTSPGGGAGIAISSLLTAPSDDNGLSNSLTLPTTSTAICSR